VQVVAKHGKELTESALKEMPYTDACIRELLRIYPIAGLLGRRAKQDFTLDGFNIEQVQIPPPSPLSLGKCPSLFDQDFTPPLYINLALFQHKACTSMCQVCELRLAMEDHISPCQNSYIKVCGFQGDELWLGINRATRLLDKR